MKIVRKAHTNYFPVPPVLVSSWAEGHKPNLITIAWTGIVNTSPPMLSISVRPERHSHKLIRETGEFVVNLARANHAREVDLCGVHSGADTDKFQLTGFTTHAASQVKVPLVKECPVNLECRVKRIVPLGSHDHFIAEILAVNVDEEYIDEHSLIDIKKMNPLAYATPHYWSLGEKLGLYGFSRKTSDVYIAR